MDGDSAEKESFALFGHFIETGIDIELLLAVFDNEEVADEAARGLVADPEMLLKYAFPEPMRFWWRPPEHYPEPAAWEWEHWAKAIKSVFLVRMVGRDPMRVVHSLVQRYDLKEGV